MSIASARAVRRGAADASSSDRSSVRNLIDSPGWRFGVVSVLGFVPVLLETVRGTNEIFDFWEHAATVHQLMLHTTNPGNALLAIHTPSAFFSPYALLVALGAKLTGAGPVHALAAAGLVNYWLLIAGLWWFTRVFSDRRQAPFYTLLFVWLLWGVNPWKYSGFFHLRALSAVIAYPSTFATALGMLTAALWHSNQSRRGRAQWLAVALTAVGLAVVVLTHPIAGTATAAALVAISLTTAGRGRSLVLLIAVAAGAGLLCLAWPYYPVLHLLSNEDVYDPSNATMYSSWIERIFPVLAALCLFFYDTGTLRRARLGIYCAVLLVVFVYGDLSRHYSDGRVISYIVIGAQIGLADLAAALERPALERLRGRWLVVVAGAIAVLAIAEVYNMRGGFRGSLPGTGAEPTVYGAYRAAVSGLPPDATVLTPLNQGLEATIPVYAGRLVATHRPLAFVSDQGERQQAVSAFFSAQANDGYRREMIARYDVRYIVVPASPPASVAQVEQLGSVIRRGTAFDTIAVK